MTLGGIVILIAFLLLLLHGIGLSPLPRTASFARAMLPLGLLLWGFPLPPWRGPEETVLWSIRVA